MCILTQLMSCLKYFNRDQHDPILMTHLQHKITSEVAVLKSHWLYYWELLLRQEDDAEERLKQLNIDVSDIPHRHVLEVLQRGRENPEAVKQAEIACIRRERERKESKTMSQITTSSHNTNTTTNYNNNNNNNNSNKPLWTDWEGYEEEQDAISHMNERSELWVASETLNSSGEFTTPEMVNDEPFVRRYTTNNTNNNSNSSTNSGVYNKYKDVPLDRYPLQFNTLVPRPILKAMYYYGKKLVTCIYVLYSFLLYFGYLCILCIFYAPLTYMCLFIIIYIYYILIHTCIYAYTYIHIYTYHRIQGGVGGSGSIRRI